RLLQGQRWSRASSKKLRPLESPLYPLFRSETYNPATDDNQSASLQHDVASATRSEPAKNSAFCSDGSRLAASRTLSRRLRALVNRVILSRRRWNIPGP